MSKEAMKLALERLQARTDTADLDAIAALNKALAEQPAQPHMTTNLHDKMLAAIDAYFSASDDDERDQAEEQLLDVRDEILKHKLAEQPAQSTADKSELETVPAKGGLLPEQQERWAVFCGLCFKEWSVTYQHPGKSVCENCEITHGITKGST